MEVTAWHISAESMHAADLPECEHICTMQPAMQDQPSEELFLLPCIFQKIATGGCPDFRILPFFLAFSAASCKIKNSDRTPCLFDKRCSIYYIFYYFSAAFIQGWVLFMFSPSSAAFIRGLHCSIYSNPLARMHSIRSTPDYCRKWEPVAENLHVSWMSQWRSSCGHNKQPSPPRQTVNRISLSRHFCWVPQEFLWSQVQWKEYQTYRPHSQET